MTPVVRGDNGLIFPEPALSRHAARLPVAPGVYYSLPPEQNGIFERFFRSLKEECLRQYNFYNSSKLVWQFPAGFDGTMPNGQALDFPSLRQFRALQTKLVA
jgi:putative transposase